MFCYFIALGLENREIWKGSPMVSYFSGKSGGALRYPPPLDFRRLVSVIMLHAGTEYTVIYILY